MTPTKRFLAFAALSLSLVSLGADKSRDRSGGAANIDSARRDSPAKVSDASPNAAFPNPTVSDKTRDRSGTAVIPTMTDEDRETARRLREAIVQDDSLSVHGKNVAILMDQGTLTLRGSVPNFQEKAAIERKAREVVGTGRIVNDIEVMAE
jgi:hypothetical protein